MTTREDERAFLQQSLADLEEEHAAGDLAPGDYARLKGDYERRLAVLDGRVPAPRRPPRRSTAARIAIGAGIAAFAVVAGVLLAQAVGRRGADGTITGADVDRTDATTTVPEPDVPEALAACFPLGAGDAFDCYIAYTRANPEDPAGFLYFGLFSVQQGLQNDSDELLSGGETFLRRALELDPALVEARVNLAVLLERTGRDDEARAELDALAGQELPEDLQELVAFVESNLAQG